MKKQIKEKSKSASDTSSHKNQRPFTTDEKGYKEEVYNHEQQENAEKSRLINKKKSTSGGES